MRALSANAHNCMDMLVKVVEITCPSCRIMQMQGARGVCALRALVVLTWPGSAPPIELEHTQLTFLYTCMHMHDACNVNQTLCTSCATRYCCNVMIPVKHTKLHYKIPKHS